MAKATTQQTAAPANNGTAPTGEKPKFFFEFRRGPFKQCDHCGAYSNNRQSNCQNPKCGKPFPGPEPKTTKTKQTTDNKAQDFMAMYQAAQSFISGFNTPQEALDTLRNLDTLLKACDGSSSLAVQVIETVAGGRK